MVSFFFELIHLTLCGESPVNTYVLLSNEYYVLILHRAKKHDANHPHLCSDEDFLNRPLPFGLHHFYMQNSYLFSPVRCQFQPPCFILRTACTGKNCQLCWICKRSTVLGDSLLAKCFLRESLGKSFRFVSVSSALVMLLEQSSFTYLGLSLGRASWIIHTCLSVFPSVLQHCLDSSFLFQSYDHHFLLCCLTT